MKEKIVNYFRNIVNKIIKINKYISENENNRYSNNPFNIPKTYIWIEE